MKLNLYSAIIYDNEISTVTGSAHVQAELAHPDSLPNGTLLYFYTISCSYEIGTPYVGFSFVFRPCHSSVL